MLKLNRNQFFIKLMGEIENLYFGAYPTKNCKTRNSSTSRSILNVKSKLKVAQNVLIAKWYAIDSSIFGFCLF